jgi:hypothetical protein
MKSAAPKRNNRICLIIVFLIIICVTIIFPSLKFFDAVKFASRETTAPARARLQPNRPCRTDRFRNAASP